MHHTMLVLLPVLPITSPVPWVEQCTTRVVYWAYNIHVVVKKCSFEEVKPKLEAKNGK